MLLSAIVLAACAGTATTIPGSSVRPANDTVIDLKAALHAGSSLSEIGARPIPVSVDGHLIVLPAVPVRGAAVHVTPSTQVTFSKRGTPAILDRCMGETRPNKRPQLMCLPA